MTPRWHRVIPPEVVPGAPPWQPKLRYRKRLIKTAFHEAGHCLVGLALGRQIASATIVAKGRFLGRVIPAGENCDDVRNLMLESGDPTLQAAAIQSLFGEICFMLAGHVVESLWFDGDPPETAEWFGIGNIYGGDLMQADDLVTLAFGNSHDGHRFYETAGRRVMNFLKRTPQRESLARLADRLLSEGTLGADEVHSVPASKDARIMSMTTREASGWVPRWLLSSPSPM